MGGNMVSTKGAREDNDTLHMDGGGGALGAGVLNVGDLDSLAGDRDDMTAAAAVLRAGSSARLVVIGGRGLGVEVETPDQCMRIKITPPLRGNHECMQPGWTRSLIVAS
jgi:hypothetical protein